MTVPDRPSDKPSDQIKAPSESLQQAGKADNAIQQGKIDQTMKGTEMPKGTLPNTEVGKSSFAATASTMLEGMKAFNVGDIKTGFQSLDTLTNQVKQFNQALEQRLKDGQKGVPNKDEMMKVNKQQTTATEKHIDGLNQQVTTVATQQKQAEQAPRTGK